MDLFEYADELEYGELHFCVDAEIGLRAVVGIHNTNRGPAIGGTRFIEYESSNDAIFDVMRLARGMTYKAAISNLPHGGGKAVMVRPKGLTEEQRTALFTRFGQFVDSLGGRYLTCEDSGTKVSDMNVVRGVTDSVLGFSEEEGSSGDPSPFTATGVRRGIEAAVAFRYKRNDLEGLHIAIQGVGNVGYYLAKELHQRGAKLTVTDIDAAAVKRCVSELGAIAVGPEDIYTVDCDIFAPCALGAILNDKSIPKLRCDIVAGAANNQLLYPKHGVDLRERGILYAPDYAINAGGLINVAEEYAGYNRQNVVTKVNAIFDTMTLIFERSERENKPTDVIADQIAHERVFS